LAPSELPRGEAQAKKVPAGPAPYSWPCSALFGRQESLSAGRPVGHRIKITPVKLAGSPGEVFKVFRRGEFQTA